MKIPVKANLRHSGLTILITLFALAMSADAFAKPARRGWREVTAADGSTIKVRLAGDEFSHQYFSEDGYPLEIRDGIFYYCGIDRDGDVVETDIAATAPARRTAEAKGFLSTLDRDAIVEALTRRALKLASRAARSRVGALTPHKSQTSAVTGAPFDKGPGLFPEATFPAYGKQKALVILVQFADVKFTLADPHDYFSRMLEERGFADYGATGCVAEYFETCSGGAFQPEFVLEGPVTLSHPMKYYGGNERGITDVRVAEMIVEACRLADDDIDFSEFDRDGDGFIDNVYVFYAGEGEATCDDPDTVWPHSWNITMGFSEPQMFDGKQLDYYACSNEWESYIGKGRPDGVGTFIHEFSHVLGLPDLYTTAYNEDAFTPGSWSVLDYGPYNNDGMTPPLYGAFERYALGWLRPREVDRQLNATLQPVSANVAGIIRTGNDNEFFLLENRRQTGWDTFIPGHGMLVWHIDYNPSVWTANTVNNVAEHQYVDIEEADGRPNTWSRDGDCFPGVSGIRSFTAQTSPAMRSWSGSEIGYPITEITETDGGDITFKVLGGNPVALRPTATDKPEDITYSSFTATWEPVEGYDHLLKVYRVSALSERREAPGTAGLEILPGYDALNVG